MDSREGIMKAFQDYQSGTNGFEGAHTWKSEHGSAFVSRFARRDSTEADDFDFADGLSVQGGHRK